MQKQKMNIYKQNSIANKSVINELKIFINNDKVSKSIIDYNKRKLANKKYIEYLKFLNSENLVKYKGKNINTLFKNLEMSGNYMQFGYDSKNERLKVIHQYIEKHTLAPLSELSKSRKNAIKLSTMMNYIAKEKKSNLYFITLTIPNIHITDLPEAVEKMNKNFRTITTNKKYKKYDVSYIKKIESTYNKKENEGHPHFHFIFEIPNEVSIDEFYSYLLYQWGKKYKININAQNCKKLDLDNPMRSAQEIATYTAKASDYLTNGYDVFKYFYLAFTNKSNLTFNGFFRELNKMYKNNELNNYLPDEFKEIEIITHIIELNWSEKEKRYLVKISEVSNYGTLDEEWNEVMKN